MNPAAVAEFVTLWLVVNVAAMATLAVMSYVSSKFILDWLEVLDRRMYASECKRGSDLYAQIIGAARDKPEA